MASTKPSVVSIHGRRFGLAPGYLIVDDAQSGPPLNVSADSSVGNSATTSEVTLKSYSLPGKSLYAANHTIYVTAFGRFAGNAQNKRATLYVGGVNITTASVTDSGASWTLTAQYTKTGTAAQRALLNGQHGSTALALSSTTDTADDTAAITIALKATSGSGSASDIICDGLVVGYL